MMPALKNPRHEIFAQALAKGRSVTEAYALAGYQVNSKTAAEAGSRLSRTVKVAARLSELQERTAKHIAVTVESLSAELDEARKKALESGQISAAVSATMGKAKLHGKLIERKHHTGTIGTYDLSKVTDEQLDHLESILGPLADTGGDQSGETEAYH